MKNLNENIGGKIEIEFQDWLDTMNDKDYPERLTLETVIEYSQDTLRDYDLDDWVPQGQSTSESKKMKDFDLKKYLAENKLLKEDQTDLFVKAGFSFDDGLLGGVGSGGGGYYDFISDKISGYHIDKFDEEEFNNWYDNFSKKDFNSLVYNSERMEDYEIDPSGLPKGIHQLQDAGAGEVMDDVITIYAYPTLSDEDGGEFITIFSLDKNGNIVPRISKEEVKAKLSSNEYSII